MSPYFTFYVLIIFCTIYFTPKHKVDCHPLNFDDSVDWVLEINLLVLHKLVRESDSVYHSIECAQDVLDKICKLNGIDSKYVELQKTSTRLLSKIKHMQANLKAALKKGGRQVSSLLKFWENEKYRLKLGGTKRKALEELQNEKKKRKIAEGKTKAALLKAKNAKREAKRNKKEAKQTKQIVNRLIKRRLRPTRNVASKAKYSRQWVSKNKIKTTESADLICSLLRTGGLEPHKLVYSDQYGNVVNCDFTHAPQNHQPSVEQMLYLKDMSCTSDKTYQEFALTSNGLWPSLYSIKRKAAELNSMFNFQVHNELRGVTQRLEDKLIQSVSRMNDAELIDGGTVQIKISGDGTSIGSRIPVTNIAFSIITKFNQSQNFLLIIAKQPEKYDSFKPILEAAGLLDDVQNLKELHIRGKVIKPAFYMCADLKFLNEMYGLGACSSIHSCVFCKCPSDCFYDMSKEWSMLDTIKGARTVHEINEMAQWSGSRKKKFNCLRSPIFRAIDIKFIVPDLLHLYLRISDQLIRKLLQELRTRDNQIKNTKSHKNETPKIENFEKFVRSIGIEWHFSTDAKDVMNYRCFIGPEHKKIQERISLGDMMPWLTTLQDVIKIWNDFKILMSMTKDNIQGEKLIKFKELAKSWVTFYASTYQTKDVTLYMHILAMHVGEAILLHGGCINHFSQQSFEKMNDQVKESFFKASNHKGLVAFKQIMQKQNRIEMLSPTCSREIQMQSCSCCGASGHNIKTCSMVSKGSIPD
ncbi:uncharacterized protein LOC119721418 [Patiria miniata]|uniref:Uncharacterized protein n=1 Tax=Patiria miniata TaxID=46514 RepID=A0A913Z969_PATMI|nr:uncharacterized protein LOC119721418 [Patiria miniata]